MVRPHTLKAKKLGGSRDRVARCIESPLFVRFIASLILLNALTLGLDADPKLLPAYQGVFYIVDLLVISVFVIEMLLKLYAYRLNFFRVGWNVFDFIIVVISLVPQTSGFSVLRTFRVFRIFRLITIIPQMRSVIGALFHAIPGMASIIGVLFVIVYVAAVLAMQLFGQGESPVLQDYFGSLGASLYTMFQLMTLEDWTDIANAAMREYAWAWAFFIVYIVITTFAVLNLFIGIIVDALHIVKEQDIEKEEESLMAEIMKLHEKIDSLQKEVKQVKK